MGASTQKKGCAFCGALEALDGGPLAPCESCNMAAYCGEEHQKFDWKRHKMFCKTVQAKNAAALQNRQRNGGQTELAFLSSTGYRHPKTSTSSDASTSSAASNQPSTSSDCSSSLPSTSPQLIQQQMISANGGAAHSGSPDISLVNCKLTAGNPGMHRTGSVDDPDIQIIENPEPRANRAVRKRPQPSTKQFKDHMANPIYNKTLSEHLASLLANPLNFPPLTQYDAIALRMNYIAEHAIKSLNEYGWAVIDNFYGIAHCRQALQEMETLYNHGLFSAGQLATQRSTLQPQDVRSDEIFWFDMNDEKVAGALSIRLLISTIDSVTAHFRDRIPPYKVCSRSRPMIAVYPGNEARYVKHVDNPTKDGRCITSIYYCNENWDANRDGGTLRLYPETSATPITIDPLADRLLLFFSDRRNPHEVLPTLRKRFALTIWYYDRDEKDAASQNRRLEQTRSIDTAASATLEALKTAARLSTAQEAAEVAEPPAKWKIERPHISSPASYPGQPSRLSGGFPVIYSNEFRNPNLTASTTLCPSPLYHSNVILSSQSLLKDVMPFTSNLKMGATGMSGKPGLVLGSAPSAFMDARSDVARSGLPQSRLQVDDRLSV